MANVGRADQWKSLARHAVGELFDQRDPFGRLALVQVLMLAGSTLVTISLAGSLFFSISPNAAKGQVFWYLVLTIAPFAVVSPFLGPLIDRSRGARRAMVVISALAQAILCPFMAMDVKNFLLFPEAFLILVFSKLYLVTRGTLVPELARIGTGGEGSENDRELDQTATDQVSSTAFAALNARLTLLGTLAGFVASIPGVILLKAIDARAVLVFDAFVFAAAAAAGLRLPIPNVRRRSGPRSRSQGRRVAVLGGGTHPEVLFGLTTMSVVRGLVGFMTFLFAFGLRREHAGLWWFGLALAGNGIGSLLGLLLVARLRQRLKEHQLLFFSVGLIGIAAIGAAVGKTLLAQVALAFIVGIANSFAQPSFTAIAQRYVPAAAQGRSFARFATRQQLVWVLGSIIPVIVAMNFVEGDVIMATVAGVVALFYVTGRRTIRSTPTPPAA